MWVHGWRLGWDRQTPAVNSLRQVERLLVVVVPWIHVGGEWSRAFLKRSECRDGTKRG